MAAFDDFSVGGCESLTTYLVDGIPGAELLGIELSFGVGPLSIDGGFSFTPFLKVGLIGDICLQKWKLRFGFDVESLIEAR